MTKSLVINDLHLGVQRTGGTTIASAAALREYAHRQHKKLLQLAVDRGCSRIIYNGDVADAYDISLSQALDLYATLDEFLSDEPPCIEVVMALGNHDLSKDSSKLGTVAFVGALLAMKHDGFRLVDKPADIGQGIYIIPHVANQELFDLELSKVPDGTKLLLLHCNYDNKFACDADHSLNLSRAQAKDLKARGIEMVLGHEHQQAESLGGSVLIVGNQFPTSVSDCLGNDDKRALIVDGHEFSLVRTWTPDDEDGWFAEVDWRELSSTEEEGSGFIRVVGDATAEEAADAVKAISAFRQRSKAYVVTNAVKVEQAEALEEIAASIEEIKSVQVIDLLLDMLDAEQQKAIKALYEGN